MAPARTAGTPSPARAVAAITAAARIVRVVSPAAMSPGSVSSAAVSSAAVTPAAVSPRSERTARPERRARGTAAQLGEGGDDRVEVGGIGHASKVHAT